MTKIERTVLEVGAILMLPFPLCASWSEPLLVEHTALLEVSCHGSFVPVSRAITTSHVCPSSPPALSQVNPVLSVVARNSIAIMAAGSTIMETIPPELISDQSLGK